MEERKSKTSEKAILITTALTILIAGTEVFNASRYYKPGMNFPELSERVAFKTYSNISWDCT